MWKGRNPEVVPSVPAKEAVIDKRDQTIRTLIDDLVAGAQELRALYSKENSDTTGRG